jgi:Uma2 family endonuclease
MQPDLVFVSNERRGIIADLTLKGPPDLVIEVLSPGTARRDRGLKHRLYARRGIAQYWIVDPDADAVEVHRFGEDPAFERFAGGGSGPARDGGGRSARRGRPGGRVPPGLT